MFCSQFANKHSAENIAELADVDVENRPEIDKELIERINTVTMGEDENLQSLVAELEMELQTKGWSHIELILEICLTF